MAHRDREKGKDLTGMRSKPHTNNADVGRRNPKTFGRELYVPDRPYFPPTRTNEALF